MFMPRTLIIFYLVKMEIEEKEVNGVEEPTTNANSPASSSSAPPPLLKQPQAPGLKVPQITPQSRYLTLDGPHHLY